MLINSIRNFFEKEDFLEVETPLLVPNPDPSPYNELFETTKICGKRAFLTPSPEFLMKKLIATKKFPKIFQICKAFRNPQELDPLHNPEFTILEWYRINATYIDLMLDCENLISFIVEKLKQKFQISNFKFQIKKSKLKNFINYQNTWIDITPPWQRITLKEAFYKFANINLDEFLNLKKAKEIAKKKGYQVEKNTTWEQIYHQIFLNEIEPNLPKEKPIILYDYPSQLAALSKLKEKDKRYAERFEFYIGGLELGNGYSELNNAAEQEKRLKADIQLRKKMGMLVFDYDKDFVKAVGKMPKCAGIAVGIDRLIMLFSNAKTIQEVISFPATKIF